MIHTQLTRATAALRLTLHRLHLLSGQLTTTGDIHPTDSPSGSIAGPDPLRVAVIGEREETSLGVLSHELGVAGFLARAAAELTGSGVRWSTTEVGSGRLREISSALDTLDEPHRISVAVLMLGLTDARVRTPVTVWEEQLRHSIDDIKRRLSAGAWTLVAEIPLSDPVPHGGHRMPRLTSEHAHVLNERTRAVATRYARVVTVADPTGAVAAREPESRSTLYSRIHRAWGLALAHAIAETGSAQ